jgi:hypothetical protein
VIEARSHRGGVSSERISRSAFVKFSEQLLKSTTRALVSFHLAVASLALGIGDEFLLIVQAGAKPRGVSVDVAEPSPRMVRAHSRSQARSAASGSGGVLAGGSRGASSAVGR